MIYFITVERKFSMIISRFSFQILLIYLFFSWIETLIARVIQGLYFIFNFRLDSFLIGICASIIPESLV